MHPPGAGVDIVAKPPLLAPPTMVVLA